MKKLEDGSQPLENPRLEIYCIEQSAGLSQEDATHVAGLGWEMRREPGEVISTTKSRLARQTLRRLNARLAVLAEIERGVDPTEHREFLSRNRRARAELDWFRLVLISGGVEPDVDSDGNLVLPPPTNAKERYPKDHATSEGSRWVQVGRWAAASEATLEKG